MKPRTMATMWCVVLGSSFVLATMPLPASGADEEGVETSSKAVTMDQVPKAAQKVIKKEAGKNEIKELEEKVINGKTVYAAAWVVDGKEVEVQVDASGKVTFRKAEAVGEEAKAEDKPAAREGSGEEDGKDVTIDQLPGPVRNAARQEAGKNEIKEIEAKTVDRKTVYEISWVAGGQETEIVVAADGKVLSRKVEAAEDEKDSQEKPDKAAKADEFRSTFEVDKKNLASVGKNPYFPLVPGHKVHLAKGDELVVISVTNETKVIDGVECRVVVETETVGGEVKEISRNYFATDKTNNNVYYFGEDVDIYTNGKVTGHEGGWLSGVKGATFGLMVPGEPKVGDKFYNEVAPKVAMDRSEIIKTDATLETPLKSFSNVVYIKESSPLEAGGSQKWYAKGIGLVGDDELRAVKVVKPGKGKRSE